jgi:hypothetical protein
MIIRSFYRGDTTTSTSTKEFQFQTHKTSQDLEGKCTVWTSQNWKRSLTRKLSHLNKIVIPLINTNLHRQQVSTKYSYQQESFFFSTEL